MCKLLSQLLPSLIYSLDLNEALTSQLLTLTVLSTAE